MSIITTPFETPTKPRRPRASSEPTSAQIGQAAHGAHVGREAAATLNALIYTSRAQCDSDVAVAAWATVLLHTIKDNGLPGDRGTGDSVGHALRDIRSASAISTGLTPTAIAELLPGVGATRASEILVAGRRRGK